MVSARCDIWKGWLVQVERQYLIVKAGCVVEQESGQRPESLPKTIELFFCVG